MAIDLIPLCARGDDMPTLPRIPWRDHRHTWATNGVLIVRGPWSPDWAPCEFAGRARKVFERAWAAWHGPRYRCDYVPGAPPPPRKCLGCASGTHLGYDDVCGPCFRCDGSGLDPVPEDGYIDVAGMALSVVQYRLLQRLPNLAFGAPYEGVVGAPLGFDNGSAILFAFGADDEARDWCGVVRPLSRCDGSTLLATCRAIDSATEAQ